MTPEEPAGSIEHRMAALYRVAWQAYAEAYTQDGLAGRSAMERAVQAVLRWLGDRPYHVGDFGEHAFTIAHPLACRPNLLDCPYSGVGVEEPPGKLGRYRLSLDDDGRLLIGDQLPINEEERP